MNAKKKIGIGTILVLILLIIKTVLSLGKMFAIIIAPIGFVVTIFMFLVLVFILVKFLKWCFV
jgi:hypothetical protein